MAYWHQDEEVTACVRFNETSKTRYPQRDIETRHPRALHDRHDNRTEVRENEESKN